MRRSLRAATCLALGLVSGTSALAEAGRDRPSNLLRDPAFRSDDAWTVAHSPGFEDVGPLESGAKGFRLGVIATPRGGERSTVSQSVSLETGRRYLLTFRYQTGAAAPPPAGYQELFVELDEATVWKADLAVPDFPPRTAKLLFEAPAERVKLAFGKRALKPGSGWLFPGSVFDLELRPATADDMGDPVAADKVVEAPADGPRWTAQVRIAERFVAVGETCAVEVLLEGAEKLATEEREAMLRAIDFEFPGLEELERVLVEEGRGIRVRGRIVRPGFLPFRLALRYERGRHARMDYIVGVPKEKRDPGAFADHGYYVFLGNKNQLAGNRVASWKLDDWKRLVDWMHDNGANQLWLTFNCYWLAYPSKSFPELVCENAANVKDSFVGELVDYAHAKQVRVHAGFALDDYIDGFAGKHPELRSVDQQGRPRRGVMCLEEPEVRKYLLGVVRECFELYPNLDGVVVHPNESGSERFNDATKKAYLADTGMRFDRASAGQRVAWYAKQTGKMIGEMHAVARQANPKAECIAFEVPELVPYKQILKDALPAGANICCWHYPHHGTYAQNPRIRDWARVFGENKVFMPNGFNYGYPPGADAQLQRHIANDRLLSAAHANGYEGAVYYVHFLLDSEPDRLRDLLMAKYPTSSWVRDSAGRRALLQSLHEEDTIAVRRSLAPAAGSKGAK